MTEQVLAPDARSWLGCTVAYPPYPVTAVEIAKYAYVIGAETRIHFDAEAAQAAGYRDVVAPLGFHMVMRHACPNLVPISELAEDGGGDDMTPPNNARRRIAGESTTEFLGPLVAGDVVTLTKRIVDMAEKLGRSGPLATVTYALEYRNQSGDLLVRENYVRVLR